jgi:hypothetical protein
VLQQLIPTPKVITICTAPALNNTASYSRSEKLTPFALHLL